MVDALDNDLIEVGKIAVANLRERSDYYSRLTHAPGDPPTQRRRNPDVGCD